MRGAIFISDERMRYAYETLLKYGYQMDFANDAESGRILVEKDPKQYDFIVAPVRGALDGKMSLKGEEFEVDTFLRGLKEGIPFITGFKTDYLKSLPLKLISFQDDLDFGMKNAKYTAEGVLMMIIANTIDSIEDYTYDVIGYGKTGECIVNLLEKLDLKVRVVSGKQNSKAISMNQWIETKPANVIINTIPVSVPDFMPLDQFDDVVIIDISSMRLSQGLPQRYRDKIEYYPAPPLPGKVAPRSAGIAYGDFVNRIVG